MRLKAMLPQFGGRLTILAYHRVLNKRSEAEGLDEDVISCTAAEFRREMAFMLQHFDLVSFAELAAGIGRFRNPAIVTFDDGYKDNHAVALPILKETGAKATFFVTTGFVSDGTMPWWDEIAYLVRHARQPEIRLSAAGQTRAMSITTEEGARLVIARILEMAKRVSDRERRQMIMELHEQCDPPSQGLGRRLMMTWSDVRDLVRSGMEVGSHTVTHPILGRIEDPAALRSELVESRRILEFETGQPVTALSYPVGRVSTVTDDVVARVQEAGYRYGCVYEHGVNAIEPMDPLRLKRIKAEVGDDFTRFRAKVLFPEWVRY